MKSGTTCRDLFLGFVLRWVCLSRETPCFLVSQLSKPKSSQNPVDWPSGRKNRVRLGALQVGTIPQKEWVLGKHVSKFLPSLLLRYLCWTHQVQRWVFLPNSSTSWWNMFFWRLLYTYYLHLFWSPLPYQNKVLLMTKFIDQNLKHDHRHRYMAMGHKRVSTNITMYL